MSATDTKLATVTKLTNNNRWLNRLKAVRELYINQFGNPPSFYVRVPGRVNIIGEHVDYCGYPVLPMAIDQCILLAVGHTEENTCLHLRNIDEKFENFKCNLTTIQIDSQQSGSPEWWKYFLCGVKGVYETLKDDFRPIGMTVALSGDIPPAAGLSSSSALVSAATLATAFVHNIPLNRKFLASVSARCERYIGTQGGGMDQAIAFLAKEGCAQFIEFYPELKATPIQLPQGVCFVVANSLAKMNKAATSDFNQRVVECYLGCRMLAKQSGFIDWKEITHFARLQAMLCCDHNYLKSLALKSLVKEIYSRDDLIQELCISIEELENEFLTANTRNLTHFKIRQRTLHVLQESQRVIDFRATCEALNLKATSANNINGRDGSPDAVKESISSILLLSQLMCQSHNSLRSLYECSHPDLDQLVRISENIGVGARLTGAGWGGCIVALCDSQETSERYINELKEKFYVISNEQCLDNVIFATFPSSGAEIFLEEESL